MLIGSNNSLTYLRPSSWWSKILKWFNRTQNRPYDIQYIFYDVRMFDIRLDLAYLSNTFYNEKIYKMLDFFNKREDVFVKLTLNNPKEDINAERKFKNICHIVESIYSGIKFYGGYRRCDGEILYEFDYGKKHELPKIINPSEWSSMYRFFTKWCPFMIKHFNRFYIEDYERKDCYLILNYVNKK